MSEKFLNELKKDVLKLKNPKKETVYRRFFKTGPGQYGEGDKFYGLTTPQSNKIVTKYKNLLELNDLQNLLNSKIHEHRAISLGILKHKFLKGSPEMQDEIYNLYLKNTHNINNWDLVDISAPHIVGTYLLNRKRKVLYKLAKSKLLWERRIAILATFTFIRNEEYDDTIAISEILVNDNHDLIHKAVGWMLREVGKRDQKAEEKFLKKHYETMPRTMLRYAIEKFDDAKRDFYMGRTK